MVFGSVMSRYAIQLQLALPQMSDLFVELEVYFEPESVPYPASKSVSV